MIELAQYTTEGDAFSEVWGLLVMVGLAVIFGAWTADAAERKGISRGIGWARAAARSGRADHRRRDA